MVSVEQTHPANRVNNAHRAHPSIFTSFDLTFNARDSFSQRVGRGKQHRVESSISLFFFSSKELFSLWHEGLAPDVPFLFPHLSPQE